VDLLGGNRFRGKSFRQDLHCLITLVHEGGRNQKSWAKRTP
jgi:hypothetical protein